jgi:ribosomal protein S18
MARKVSDRRRRRKVDQRRGRKKKCILCVDKVAYVDYKDVALLRKYMSDRAKIRSSHVTGNCGQHQRMVARSIKNAREMALLPYVGTGQVQRRRG